MTKATAPLNREAWLTEATVHLTTELFRPEGLDVPEVRVSVGWPSRGATSAKNRVIGQCWYPSATDDEIPHIFISPTLDKEVGVLETLVHEMVHAALPEGTKHGPGFAKAMKLVGLEGKPTATNAGSTLAVDLSKLTKKLGPYPHKRIRPGPKAQKQTSRLLKVECPDCGYIARITAKWLDEVGAPICPADEVEFELAG